MLGLVQPVRVQAAVTTRLTPALCLTSTAKVRALSVCRSITMLTPSFSQTQVFLFHPLELAALRSPELSTPLRTQRFDFESYDMMKIAFHAFG